MLEELKERSGKMWSLRWTNMFSSWMFSLLSHWAEWQWNISLKMAKGTWSSLPASQASGVCHSQGLTPAANTLYTLVKFSFIPVSPKRTNLKFASKFLSIPTSFIAKLFFRHFRPFFSHLIIAGILRMLTERKIEQKTCYYDDLSGTNTDAFPVWGFHRKSWCGKRHFQFFISQKART